MTKTKRCEANTLFQKLFDMRPCVKCSCTTCEECRWKTFAASRYSEAWDYHDDECRTGKRQRRTK